MALDESTVWTQPDGKEATLRGPPSGAPMPGKTLKARRRPAVSSVSRGDGHRSRDSGVDPLTYALRIIGAGTKKIPT